MNSIDTFYFRYYANRLLREGYIDEKEYRVLLNRNGQDAEMDIPEKNKKSCLPD